MTPQRSDRRQTKRKWLGGSAVASLLTALAIALCPTPATAANPPDYGDGSIFCNPTEICFSGYMAAYDEGWEKHFYNGARHTATAGHGDYHWTHIWQVNGGSYQYASTNILVVDDALSLWNRDSSCTVYVWEIYGGAWRWYTSRPAQDTLDYPISSVNEGHTRCDQINSPAGL